MIVHLQGRIDQKGAKRKNHNSAFRLEHMRIRIGK